MNYRQLQNELNKNIFSPVYLFVAGDMYIAKSYASLIKKLVAEGDFSSMNINTFDDKAYGAQEIMNAVLTLPVMSDRRYVEIDLDCYAKSAEVMSALAGYAAAPSETTVLILLTSQLPKTSALYKAVAKTGKVVEFEKLTAYELKDWIKNSFEKRGFKIKPDALEYFVEAGEYHSREAGVDTGYFANEIEKIAAYHPGSKEVTVDALRTVSSKNNNEDIFALTDHMLSGNLKGAFYQLDRLIYNKAVPQQVIAQIAGAVRRVAICAYMTQNGLSQAEIAKKWAYHPYAVKKAVEAGKYFSVKDALNALLALDDADTRIKRGEADPQTELAVVTQAVTSKIFACQQAERDLF
jgi:DNA polymerase-3 subunit delta